SIFLPKILAWEDFLLELYLNLTPLPKMILPEEARILLFMESLEREKLSQDPRSLFYWGTKFLEVFDEFEKEGKVPSKLLYPPENLPKMAKDLFEELSSTYEKFKGLLEEKKVIFPSLLLSEIRTLLLESRDNLLTFLKGLVIAGFAALRNSEKEVMKTLIESLNEVDLPIYIFFADDYPPHPLIQVTLKDLNLNASLIPQTYLEIPSAERKINLFSFPDPESEVSKVLELIQYPIEEYDNTAIILPLSIMLLPLYQRLENLETELNITLPFPSKLLSLCQFLQLLLKTQREKIKEGIYPLEILKKIFNYPLVKAFFRKEPYFEGLLQKLNKIFEELKFRQIDIKELALYLESPYREFFEKLVEIFLRNFEHLEGPKEVKVALQAIVELVKPLFEEVNSLEEFLLSEYIALIIRDIYSLFDYEPLWKSFPLRDNLLFYLTFLDWLLSSIELPLVGEPLAGLQIMGFLEGRLLYFDRMIILDVNEGSLPPHADINPLLTEEIKRYLGLPIFKNDLWDYYFKCLLNSGKEINLFYISTSKGKGDLVKEPSRYILKYKWELEKVKKTPNEEIFKPPIVIKVPKKDIPKSDKDLENIHFFLKNRELSRSFFETYLYCPVKFYFQYLLGLRPLEETSITDKDIGNFLHKYFEEFFRKYLKKSLSFEQILESREWEKTFTALWREAKFERGLDPLSLWLTEKVTRACIEKYFEYLKRAEKEGIIEDTVILGVEEELRY
ncbi:MAG: PD-(D/E)XK nuclease family protein, partial [Caldimicrobium sp.]